MRFDGILFSDLHLSPDTGALNTLFDAFVDAVAGTKHVACLGDLFEYCIGPKQLDTEHGRHVFEGMQRLAAGAESAIWVAGNRDFMFDPSARKAGFKTFRNVYRGDFCGVPVALEHGDRFCTLDRRYQRFRWWFRKIPFNTLAAMAPASACHAFARKVRSKSQGETARKNPSMFGIQPERVERHIARGAEAVVCGHVHTPLMRTHKAGGREGRLLVMSDWHDDGAVVCGVKDGEFKLMRFDGEGFQDFEAPQEQAVWQEGAVPAGPA
jgi:UDP-2,3-diacylglucosamine hydrolase